MASRQAVRNAGVYRRRRFIVAGFGAVLALLFCALIFEGVGTWLAYDKTFGAQDAGKDWLHRKITSYSVDAYDSYLAIKRLQIYCFRFGSGRTTKQQFSIQRRQVASVFASFDPGTFMAAELAIYGNFKPAYEKVVEFLVAAEALENGTVDVDTSFEAGERASEAWGFLTVESIHQEFQLRDRMESAIVEFRPLAVQAFIVTSVLTVLCIGLFAVAAYAGWRALRSEGQRFDRFELLLSTVGHDLRSPLQALVGAAKLAAADALPNERMKFVSIVNERSVFFTRLLDDLINLARAESLSYEAAPLNLAAWYAGTEARYRQDVEKKGLRFSATLKAPHLPILFDAHRLTQCADNLISNAIRYTDVGSVSLKVVCHIQPEEVGVVGTLTLEVEDTGRGIAPSDQDRIFEPFVRLKSEVKGMGVGLTMVASFAQSVGGSVSVQSAMHHGSTFTFSAPVCLAAEWSASGSAADRSNDRLKRSVETAAPANPSASTPKVLVVDDDPLITEVIKGLLPHMGFAADVASGGLEGLSLAKYGSYCAVLTDIQMPDMNGFELAKQLRECMDPCPTIIAMTAHTATPSADDRAQVFDSTLAKPVNEDELIRLLDLASTRPTQRDRLNRGMPQSTSIP